MLRSTFFNRALSLSSCSIPCVLPRCRAYLLRRPPTVCAYSSSASPPPTSAYVHLPFCRKRCYYCDFPVVALGSSAHPDADPRVSSYVRLLLRDIAATKPPVSDSDEHPPLQTVFFGGGTPSLVPPTIISSILDALSVKFSFCESPEVSIEMDPGTFDKEKLAQMLELGVNRVSLGVQAFQEELLNACGRAHGLKEVYEAIEMVTSCPSLQNWSMDLISSLPHQTRDMWEESLRCAIHARPTHLSIYDLQIEQGTKFGQLYSPGEFPLPTESQSAQFYKIASQMLSEAGYNHYEISSYCLDGYECKHNLTYWGNRSFYGFGLGSASYINGMRLSRPRRLREYTEWVQKLEEGTKHHDFHVDAKEMAMDVMMLSLRTARGLDLRSFARSFGRRLVHSLCEGLKQYVESGHVIAMDDDRNLLTYHEFELKTREEDGVAFIRLSDPDGFLLSNELISIAFGIISP
ncbi:heme chaperone HemW-like [Zingiber officinale]|uniref:Radical S-adenosyl methionine domain-containing protein 1, mitochondrial n=1 Tax=Zingiber officinale TaxID=94328 RepID=A0A8J5FB10_ZINOF|nr:heme chaperone HemW-like [Zingiber officinale]KAG6479839.1 hypothetical protein ZIOFF_063314 [Zingiber officinale]